MRWYLRVLKKYLDFAGRASRKEFWTFFLIHLLVLVLLAYKNHVPWLFVVYFWATLPPYTAVSVRRLHDANFSGWWLLVLGIPVCALLLLILHLLDSSSGPNRYGPNPKIEVAFQPASPLSSQHEAHRLRQKSAGCFIVCAVYLIPGLFMLFILGELTYPSYQTWPVYQAQIVNNEIVPSESSQGKPGYGVHLNVVYVVDGKTRTSEITLWNASYADATGQATEFPVGSWQTVHYNPRIPNPHPVLAFRDNQARHEFHKVIAALLIPLLGGPIFGLLGAYFLIAARGSQRALTASA